MPTFRAEDPWRIWLLALGYFAFYIPYGAIDQSPLSRASPRHERSRVGFLAPAGHSHRNHSGAAHPRHWRRRLEMPRQAPDLRLAVPVVRAEP